MMPGRGSAMKVGCDLQDGGGVWAERGFEGRGYGGLAPITGIGGVATVVF